MRVLKWLLVILVVVLAVPIGAFLLIPQERIVALLEEQVESATGRSVRFEGGISPSVYPNLGVTTGPVEIANAEWSASGPILRAKSLHVAIDPFALLSGEIAIGDITADTPEVLLETSESGAVNWSFFEETSASDTKENTPSTPQGERQRISLKNLSLTDAAIRFIDRQNGTEVEILELDVSVQAPDATGPTDFEITFSRGAGPITLQGQLAETEAFLNGENSRVAATLTAAGSDLSFEGLANITGAAQGAISANIKETKSLLAAVGLPGIDLPPGFGRSGSLSAELTYGPTPDAALNTIRATLDNTQLNGNLAASFTGVPKITGAITSPRIDLTALTSASGTNETSNTSATSTGWSKAPIDASALAAVDADISLAIDRLDAAGLSASNINVGVELESARAVVALKSAQAFGGSLNGQIVANNRSGFSTRITMAANGVQLENLLGQFVGYERLIGTGSAQINVLGVGNSVDALMRSLSGEGQLGVPSGELVGIALADLILNEGQAGGRTVFSDLGAQFSIEQGVLNNSDLFAQLPAASVSGAGTVDIGNQMLNYRLTPRLADDAEGAGLVFPVQISGPWSGPKIRPDLEAAIKQSFQAEIDAKKEELENAAKEALESEVQDKLGISQEEGQSLEDAVKNKVQNDLLKGLGDLLK